jgi:hypothetical protein
MAKNYFWPRGAQQRIPRFARIYQTLAHRIWVPPLVLPLLNKAVRRSVQ